MNTKNGSSIIPPKQKSLPTRLHGVTHPEHLTLNTHHHEYFKTYKTEPYSIPVLFVVFDILIFL